MRYVIDHAVAFLGADMIWLQLALIGCYFPLSRTGASVSIAFSVLLDSM
jgi:hypothetical protein